MATRSSASRRSIVAAFGAGSLGLALSPHVAGARHAEAAQDASLAGHPMVGVWLAMVPLPSAPDHPVAVTSIYTADGIVTHTFPPTEGGRQGVTHKGTAVGVWEAVDERAAHFTTVQVLSSQDGAFLGTITLDGHPMASEDGTTFSDDGVLNSITIRDATNAIINVIAPGPPQPVRAFRITPGNVQFPEPPAATPAADRSPLFDLP